MNFLHYRGTCSSCRTSAIDAAPKTISKLLTTVHEDSGWCFTVVGAGPSPRDGGAIKSFAYVIRVARAAA